VTRNYVLVLYRWLSSSLFSTPLRLQRLKAAVSWGFLWIRSMAQTPWAFFSVGLMPMSKKLIITEGMLFLAAVKRRSSLSRFWYKETS
jgi:hypothetical protein